MGLKSNGLFLSAGSSFSLMSVSVAPRTREIGLRAALGASSAHLLASIFSRPVVLLGTGIVAGNIVLLLLTTLEPARRALRIDPTNALKEG